MKALPVALFLGLLLLAVRPCGADEPSGAPPEPTPTPDLDANFRRDAERFAGAKVTLFEALGITLKKYPEARFYMAGAMIFEGNRYFRTFFYLPSTNESRRQDIDAMTGEVINDEVDDGSIYSQEGINAAEIAGAPIPMEKAVEIARGVAQEGDVILGLGFSPRGFRYHYKVMFVRGTEAYYVKVDGHTGFIYEIAHNFFDYLKSRWEREMKQAREAANALPRTETPQGAKP